MTKGAKIEDAQTMLRALGLPTRQHNRMSALTLLAIVDVKPDDPWSAARSRLIGIDSIRQWMARHYGVEYAPNTRETIRRQAVHYFMQASVVQRNPDNPNRSTNDKNNVYGVTPDALQVIVSFASPQWEDELELFRSKHGALAERYAARVTSDRVPVVVDGKPYTLSPGRHNRLQAAVITDFAPRFAPGAHVLYIGDTADKDLVLKTEQLAELGIPANQHDKLPDIILYDPSRDWLFLVEAVTSHGPVSPKRHEELSIMAAECRAGLIFITAFPDGRTFRRQAADIAWRTDVWIATDPEHLIHFDGERFLGPYADTGTLSR
ncbi:MAG TPA: BsuBI/PstI family type II restriction endonuclease [Thermomicrobiales bacterium]|jgi:hypothetical protein